MTSRFSDDPDEAQALAFMEKYGLALPDLRSFIMANLICLKVLAKHANLPLTAQHLQGVIDEMEATSHK